jgi:hypothetical protein
MNLINYSELTIKFDYPLMNLTKYSELIIKFDYPLMNLIIEKNN